MKNIQVSKGNNRVAVYRNGRCVWFKRCRNAQQTQQVYYEVMIKILDYKQ